jgi:hypothetical protein
LNDTALQQKILKAGPFGTIGKISGSPEICRDTDRARWWARGAARRLAAREARALIVLDDLAGIPKLRGWNGRQLRREWLDGSPMQEARPAQRSYYREALRLLRQMHSHNIAHNDLAKEANCLVLATGGTAFVDFQLSVHAPRRGYLFRLLAREDLRHLLKHKAYYCAEHLTSRQRRILATPSVAARLWTHGYKPLYLWVTRCILRWPEREGANERVYTDNTTHRQSHNHSMNASDTKEAPFGIRVSLPPGDPFTHLLDDGWQKTHWYQTPMTRDLALHEMCREHEYSRSGDKPTLVFEPIERGGS